MIPQEICSSINEYFDKVLVVSVPRFTERHLRVQERLKGLRFEFFWGVDKQQLDLNKSVIDGTYDDAKAKSLQRQGKGLNTGELACSLSHRNLYASIIENGWQNVLILEDDVWPLEDHLHLLPAALKELPAQWHLLYLGYMKNERVSSGLKIKQAFYKLGSFLGLMKWNYTMVSNMLPRPYSVHLKKAGFHDCTHAYAVTAAGARNLLKAQSPVVYRADDLLSHSNLLGKITTFITVPRFFDQEDQHSSETTSTIKERG